MTRIIKTISITPEFEILAKKNHLSWTEASRVGMSMLLAELGIREYDNNLNLYRKMRAFQKVAEDLSLKIAEFEKK